MYSSILSQCILVDLFILVDLGLFVQLNGPFRTPFGRPFFVWGVAEPRQLTGYSLEYGVNFPDKLASTIIHMVTT